jgi:hypothetical protein
VNVAAACEDRMLSYDQMSAIRMAFDEAHVPVERRRSQRVRVWCRAQIVPWSGAPCGDAIDVVIVDFSTTGIGILHTGRLKVRARYLLEIPRPEQHPLRVVFTVVRCDETDGGMFDVELSPEEILDVVGYADANRAHAAAAGAKGGSALRTAMVVVAFVAAAMASLVHLLEPPQAARGADPARPQGRVVSTTAGNLPAGD